MEASREQFGALISCFGFFLIPVGFLWAAGGWKLVLFSCGFLLFTFFICGFVFPRIL